MRYKIKINDDEQQLIVKATSAGLKKPFDFNDFRTRATLIYTIFTPFSLNSPNKHA